MKNKVLNSMEMHANRLECTPWYKFKKRKYLKKIIESGRSFIKTLPEV